MVSTLALVLHIGAGVSGVLLGPWVLTRAAAGRTTRLAGAYHASVLLVCCSAAALAVLDLVHLWWFLPVAGFSYAFALRAHLAARHRRPGWLSRYVRGHGGAYIALWTAILVVSATGMPALWFLPAAIGIPLVHRLAHRGRPAQPAPAGAAQPVGPA